MDGTYHRTLALALNLVGGSHTKLAAALEITQHDLEQYLSGTRTPPQQVFLDALDIVAANGHTR